MFHISYCIYFTWLTSILYSSYYEHTYCTLLILTSYFTLFYCSTGTCFNYGLTTNTFLFWGWDVLLSLSKLLNTFPFAIEASNFKVLFRNGTELLCFRYDKIQYQFVTSALVKPKLSQHIRNIPFWYYMLYVGIPSWI